MAVQLAAEIRPAQAADHDSVRDLWERSELGRATRDEWDALMSGDTNAVLVAEEDGQIVGTAVAAFDGWRAYIYHVCVDERFRRGGIGRDLLAGAEQYLLSAGARYVYVTVSEDNTEALALVAAQGYLPEGEIVLAKRLATRFE
jgi:ribosomal protein S18 acetylase RimI-like enzyme